MEDEGEGNKMLWCKKRKVHLSDCHRRLQTIKEALWKQFGRYTYTARGLCWYMKANKDAVLSFDACCTLKFLHNRKIQHTDGSWKKHHGYSKKKKKGLLPMCQAGNYHDHIYTAISF